LRHQVRGGDALTDNTDVVTTAGTVRGSKERAGNSGRTIRVFRGVPYAAPPVGALRFNAPQPPEPWSGVREVIRATPSPMQSINSPFSGVIPGNLVGAVSEDCLTVDIWSPANPGESLPVLVWVYGGAYLTGGTTLVTYDGSTLAADHDVVVVSMNYRLGALGFLWLDDERADANCGLRDQLAGLQWIRNNVAAFGGDPSNVTAFGESAGAGSLLHLVTTSGAADVMQRCILQSPGVDHTLRPDDATRVTDIFLSHVGVNRGALKQLWELPAEAIVDAQEKTVLETLLTISSMPFHPVVDQHFLRTTPSVAFADGAAGDIDLLVCWTAEEMRLYPNPAADGAGIEGVTGWVQHYLTRRSTADPGRDRARQLVRFYENLMAGFGHSSPADIYAAIQTDGVMRLPARRSADAHASNAQGATYVAQFSWGAHVEGEAWRRGAFHAIDLPFTFGTLDRSGWAEFLGAGPDAAQLAHWHMAAWSSFARIGDPGAPFAHDPAGAPGPWPRYDNQRRATMILDSTCEVADDPLVAVAVAWDGLWSADARAPAMGVD
jgi:para-nitrobenzyl esterase